MKTIVLAVLSGSLFALSALAQQPSVKVSLNKGKFAADEDVSVSVTLKSGTKPGVLPHGSNDVAGFYQACSVPNLKDSPANSPEVFCANADYTKLIQSDNETLPAFAKKTGETYTFKQPFKIPANTPATRVWVVVFLTYKTVSGNSTRLHGSANLTEHCDSANSASPKTGKVNCAYYTPGGWAIKKGGSTVQTGKPVSPNP